MEIMAVDDDPILLHTIQMVLESEFGDIIKLNHPSQIQNHLYGHPIKVIILDLNFAVGSSDGHEGLAWISKIRETWKDGSIVILTAHGFVDIAVQSLKLGATDFIEKPFSNEKFVATIQAAKNLASSKMDLSTAIADKNLLIDQLNRSTPHVIPKSKAMRDIYHTIHKVAPTNASTLITGEHGTGKEVLARLIHHKSNRISHPFVHVDLSALAEGLFESTLFGHAKGAFTDAMEQKAGLLELANFGTLFLDGIDNIPLHLQSKLLKCIQNQEVTRVGENQPRALSLRIISSTHAPLSALSDTDQFRQDLFFRINTVVIEIPPLRDRPLDINPLIIYYQDHFNQKYNRNLQISKTNFKVLADYDWPGNIRELKNTIERMVILNQDASQDVIINEFRNTKSPENLYEFEKEKIIEAIKRHSGNISKAASELGIGRNTLYRKMKKYGI